MELKLKEGVDLNLLTTQHKIVLETLGLIEEERLYTKSELHIQFMIAVIHIMTDGVLEILEQKDVQGIRDFIETDIEPMYMNILKDKEKANVLSNLFDDIFEYINKKYKEYHSTLGFIEQIFEWAKQLKPEEIQDVKQITQHFTEGLIKKDTPKITQEEVNEKMAALMAKYNTKLAE